MRAARSEMPARSLWIFLARLLATLARRTPKENTTMRLASGIRATLFALAVALAGPTSAARADSGTISFRVLKGGWFIGASGGSGTLFFRGRAYHPRASKSF
jgi:hypothetical protein